MLFEIDIDTGNSLELVRVLEAKDLEEAREKARRLGHGKNYEIREFDEESC